MKKIILLLFGFCTTIFCQQKIIPHHYKFINKSIEDFDKNNEKSTSEFEVFKILLVEDNALFIRLYFKDCEFDDKSYIEITSIFDRKKQKLDNIKLKKWKNSSMYFNGDELLIEFYRHKDDKKAKLSVEKYLMGERITIQSIEGIESICGEQDNREPTNNKAIGRIVPIGCTAWITPTGKLVTAGHCVDGSTDFSDEIIEFNVPLSLDDGTIQHPDEEDQYLVDNWEYIYTATEDWTVFTVWPNVETNMKPKEAQNSYLELERSNEFVTNEGIRVTGCGLDGPPTNFGANNSERNKYSQTQQTDLGTYHSISGTKIRYVVDTQPANSGSPVIRENSSKAIGVHTNGGCNSDGFNSGTSLMNNNFWAEIGYYKVNEVLKDGFTSIGTIGKWNGSSFNPRFSAPTLFDIVVGQEVFHANTDIFSNQKYKNWNSESNVENHRIFTITLDANELKANFDNTYSGITIKNILESSVIDGGTIQFKDPWLIDYADPIYGNNIRNRGMSAPFKTRTSPFYPNYTTSYSGDIYKGVFLNQGGTGFTPPYYTTKAIQQQNIYVNSSVGTREFYFQNWSAYPTGSATFQNETALETPVVFNTANAIVQANLKGKLISNVTTGFNTNSQRKIVRTSNGGLHMVYESMGSVWYTYSSNGGTTWTPEQRVNPYPSNAKNVSIAESNDGNNNVYVVYQADRFVFPSTCLGLNVSKFVNGNGIWDCAIYDLTTYTYDTKPVIGVYNSLIFVVFKPTSTSQLKSIKLIIDSIDERISSITNYTVTNSTSSSQNPSIMGSLYRFFLAYQNSNTQIKYCELLQNGTIKDETTISASSGFTYNINPSISAHYDYPVISWSAYNSGIPTVAVKRKTSNVNNTWSTNSLFENGAAAYPTNNNSNGTGIDGSIIAWSNMYNQAHYVKFANGSYTTIKTLPTAYFGQDLQISNGEEFAQIKAISFYRSGSAPYQVRPVSYNFSTMQKTSEDEKFNYSRMLVLTKNNSEIVYQLGNIKLDGESIKFREINDTVTVKESKKLTEIMSTELLNLTKESSLEFADCAYFINREKTNLSTNGIKLTLELVKNNGEVISQIKEVSYNKKDTTDIKTYFKIDCSNIQSCQYFIRVSGNINEQVKYDISDCLDIEYESVNKNNLENIGLNIDELPKQYSLSQNYPNPFNPATTINYQLPKDEHVTLRIYDMLGKEVMTLINEFKTSGKYNIKFDGSNLSSGVYFYKIEAGNFSDTKKFILMK